MAGNIIGHATLNVVPATKNFGGSLRGQLTGVFARSGREGGASILSAMTSPLSRLAVMVGGAVAGFAGLKAVIGGGIARQLQIEQATAKLSGLGHSTEAVAKIMDNALQAVDGTAFGLGEAATAAASAVAAGIQPGEALTRTLRLVGDAATIAGTSYTEMGTIFNKVAAKNKLQAEEVNQLTERGVPILQMVADQYGVTAAEASKMVSQGQVDFETFQRALEANVAGAALKSGDTTMGALANMRAAFSRLGETITGGIFPVVKYFFTFIRDGVNLLNSIVKPAFTEWGATLQGALIPAFTTASEKIQAFRNAFNEALAAGNLSTLDALREAFTTTFGSVESFTDGLNRLVPGLGDVISGLSPLMVIGRAVAGVLPELGTAAQALGGALTDALIAILPSLASLLQAVADLLVVLLPPITSLITWVANVAAGILRWVTANREVLSALLPMAAVIGGVILAMSTWRAISLGLTAATYGVQGAMLVAGGAAKVYGVAMTVLSNAQKVAAAATRIFNLALAANPIGLVVTAIAALVAGLVWFFTQTDLGREIWANFTRFLGEAWANIAAVAETVWTAITGFLTAAWENVSGVATTIWTGISDFFVGLWNGVSSIFSTAWNAITGFLDGVFKTIAGLVRGYVEIYVNVFIVFAAVLKTIWDGIVSVVQAVWNGIVSFLTPIIRGIASFIGDTMRNIAAGWNAVWTAISGFFRTIWNGIVSFLTPIIRTYVQIITTAVNVVRQTWETVWSAVSSFFVGIWNGIVGFLAPIIDRVVSVISGAVQTAQSIWNSVWSGISSFFSDVWNGMVNAVSNAVGAVVNVVGGIQSAVWNAISGIGSWLYSAGSDLIRGLWNGISDMAGWIMDQIGGFMDDIVGWAKNVLGINSPSKRFATLGHGIGEGLALGISRSEGLAVAATSSLADAAVDAMAGTELAIGTDVSGSIPDGGLVGATARAAANRPGDTFETRYYDYSTSQEDKEAKLRRAARQTRRTVALARTTRR